MSSAPSLGDIAAMNAPSRWRLAAIALCVAAPACSTSLGDCRLQVLTSSWTIVDARGAPMTCATAGAAQVAVYVDDAAPSTLACDNAAGTTDIEPDKPHTISAALIDSGGFVITKISPTMINAPGCGNNATAPPFAFVVPDCAPGRVRAEWTITRAGQPASCNPDDHVTINADTTANDVACVALAGTSVDLRAANSHDISLILSDATGDRLAQTPVSSVYVNCGETVDLGSMTFAVR